MLAHEFTDKRATYPCFVQPKLDGVRMLARLHQQKVISLESRNGTDFSHLLPIFQDAVRKIASRLPADVVALDGELYRHGSTFQHLVSQVRNKSDPSIAVGLEYHVYDIFDKTKNGFADRYKTLHAAMSNKEVTLIKLVETTTAVNRNELERLLNNAEKLGYEGIMIRTCCTPYELGKRSTSLLKYKRFQTDEFVIVSFKEARGRDKGTIVFECEAHNGSAFNARPVGTLAERREMFKIGKTLVGKRMTVKFQGLSTEGIPRFPVALAIRDYE